jgi:hypothetical protein
MAKLNEHIDHSAAVTDRPWMEGSASEKYWGKRVKPKPPDLGRPFWIHPLLQLLLVLLVVLVSCFIYLSNRPRLRLLDNPPAAFAAPLPAWDAQRRDGERRLARAYWDCAVKVIQWKYGYGSELPPYPPDEFQILASSAPTSTTSGDSEARTFYWQRLHDVWPYAWKKVYGWDTTWLTKLVNQVQKAVTEKVGP